MTTPFNIISRSMKDIGDLAASKVPTADKTGANYSAENNRVKAICAATYTPEVIAAYQASLTPVDGQ
jgi:hypothetical protein